MPRPLVIEAEPISPEPRAWLAQRADILSISPDHPGWTDALAKAQGLIVRTSTRVTAAMLDAAPSLRVIARAGVGLDNIDLDAAKARSVRVVHTPGANSQAVAELVLALMLDATRPRPRITHPLSQPDWDDLRERSTATRELASTTLGIIGLGRVGARTAALAAAVGMTVLYHDLRAIDPADRTGASPAQLADLLARAHIVSLHVDARPANRNMVNQAFLAKLAPTAVLINTSRGFVIDAPALAGHLRANPAATAMLDVHDPEPIDPASPLLTLQNAVLLPHLGSATVTAKLAMSWVVKDLWRVLEGNPPNHPAP